MITDEQRAEIARFRTAVEAAVATVNASTPRLAISVWRIALSVDDAEWIVRLEAFLVASHCDCAESIEGDVCAILDDAGWAEATYAIHVSG